MHHHRAVIKMADPSFGEVIASIRAMGERYPRRRLPARLGGVRQKLYDLMRRIVSALR